MSLALTSIKFSSLSVMKLSLTTAVTACTFKMSLLLAKAI